MTLTGRTATRRRVSPSDPVVPDSNFLAYVRVVAEAMLLDIGATPDAAEFVSEEVAMYVSVCWTLLRLDCIAEDAVGFERHVENDALRRLIRYVEKKIADRATRRGPWSDPVDLSSLTGDDTPLRQWRARALIIALADWARLGPTDRTLVDAIYVHGLSVHDAARVAGLDDEDAIARLRVAWAVLRRELPNFFQSTSDGGACAHKTSEGIDPPTS